MIFAIKGVVHPYIIIPNSLCHMKTHHAENVVRKAEGALDRANDPVALQLHHSDFYAVVVSGGTSMADLLVPHPFASLYP